MGRLKAIRYLPPEVGYCGYQNKSIHASIYRQRVPGGFFLAINTITGEGMILFTAQILFYRAGKLFPVRRWRQRKLALEMVAHERAGAKTYFCGNDIYRQARLG